jgi:hypothetical protein
MRWENEVEAKKRAREIREIHMIARPKTQRKPEI